MHKVSQRTHRVLSGIIACIGGVSVVDLGFFANHCEGVRPLFLRALEYEHVYAFIVRKG